MYTVEDTSYSNFNDSEKEAYYYASNFPLASYELANIGLMFYDICEIIEKRYNYSNYKREEYKLLKNFFEELSLLVNDYEYEYKGNGAELRAILMVKLLIEGCKVSAPEDIERVAYILTSQYIWNNRVETSGLQKLGPDVVRIILKMLSKDKGKWLTFYSDYGELFENINKLSSIEREYLLSKGMGKDLIYSRRIEDEAYTKLHPEFITEFGVKPNPLPRREVPKPILRDRNAEIEIPF